MSEGMPLPKYIKVYTLGDPRLHGLLQGEVEVTEKVDGSQFRFGKFGGKLCMGSHEVNYYEGQTVDKMFLPAAIHIESIVDKLPEKVAFFGEAVVKLRQNTLEYERVPKNYVMLFGAVNFGETDAVIDTGDEVNFFSPATAATPVMLQSIAKYLEIEPPNVLFMGDGVEFTKKRMEELVTTKTSYLGKSVIEGVVIKNYAKMAVDPNHFNPVMAGKYVNKSFKEENRKNWKQTRDIEGQVIVRFSTEARWEKAVQHAREQSLLEDSMRDIKPVLEQLEKDIDEEIKPMALEMLWAHYRGNFVRGIRSGLPEWYKKKLADKQFEERIHSSENVDTTLPFEE